MSSELLKLIRDIPDFPTPGIVFKDITPLLADASALTLAVDSLARLAEPLHANRVIAAEARGFLLGPALALKLGAGFVLARKPGKLPGSLLVKGVVTRVAVGRDDAAAFLAAALNRLSAAGDALCARRRAA